MGVCKAKIRDVYIVPASVLRDNVRTERNPAIASIDKPCGFPAGEKCPHIPLNPFARFQKRNELLLISRRFLKQHVG